jgi:hypothetical protein
MLTPKNATFAGKIEVLGLVTGHQEIEINRFDLFDGAAAPFQ